MGSIFVCIVALAILVQTNGAWGARCTFRPTAVTAVCQDVTNVRDISSSFRSNWLRLAIQNEAEATLRIPRKDRLQIPRVLP